MKVLGGPNAPYRPHALEIGVVVQVHDHRFYPALVEFDDGERSVYMFHELEPVEQYDASCVGAYI